MGTSNRADLKFLDGKKIQDIVQKHGLPPHEGQIPVSSQSSAKKLELGGLGQADNGGDTRRQLKQRRFTDPVRAEKEW